jgi:hypothetical protein
MNKEEKAAAKAAKEAEKIRLKEEKAVAKAAKENVGNEEPEVPTPPVKEKILFEDVEVLEKVEGGKENERDVECRMVNGTTTMVPKSLLEPVSGE